MNNNLIIRLFGRSIPYLALVTALFAVSDFASADVLCVKRSQSLVKGELRLSPAVKVIGSTCPRGFVQLLDTSSMKGAPGSNGKAALGADNCIVRKVTAVKVNTSTDRLHAERDVTCSTGEIAHSSSYVEFIREYSADWSVDGDASAAATTVRVPAEGSAYGPPVVSSGGLVTGFKYNVGGNHGNIILDEAGTITGSLTTTNVYSFLCCQMSE